MSETSIVSSGFILRRLKAGAVFVAAALTACGGEWVAPTAPPAAEAIPAAPSPQAAVRADTAEEARARGLPDFTTLVETQGPAVVNVVTTRRSRGGPLADVPDDPLFDFFRRFSPAPPHPGPGFRGQGLGSGFIITPDGYILTNAHVVTDTESVVVRLADSSRELNAKVVGVDARTDVALLKVDAAGLPTVTLGNSENLRVGEWVAAIGSPFGFVNTITAGIVSAKGRTLPDESFVPFIQTDVPINPGNSGGPLLNLKGEVVGINSAIYSRTGGYMGVSFAIPIEVALDVSRQLRETGKVVRGRLGVQIQALTPDLAKSFKLEGMKGVLVAAVEARSPAEKAGLRSGDVILGFDGNPVQSATELPRVVAASRPGSTVTIDIWRDGARRQVTAVVGEFSPEPVAEAAVLDTRKSASRLGLTLRALAPAQLRMHGLEYGLLVESVSSAAAASEVRPGDIIIAVDNLRFNNMEEFDRIVRERPAGGTVALLVRRGDAALEIPLRIAEARTR
jgi:serine protease Do